ncbi:hypothetical protein [Rhodoferax sp. UBA5149]|uniref:hypothetical protein n=1 Tax=Rhodoferax sp. UBA5149 TaxID=1947379 RepID=UPI0025E42C79|nr:hypothetical protein [Rhodoferax sp. UBA5149]
MKQLLSKFGVVFALAASCVSCDKIKPPLPELQKPPTVSSQPVPQTGEREVFSQTAQKEIDDLRGVISEFRTKAEAANLQTKAKLHEEVEELDADLRETQQRLVELKSATVESWNQVKESFSSSLGKLKNRVDSFRRSAA